MRVIDGAANTRTGGSHHDDRHVESAGAGPTLIACDLQKVDDVEGVVGELDFEDRFAAAVGDSHRRADQSALVERGIPRGSQTLRGGEDAAERRADVFAEDVGYAEIRLAVVEGQPNCLNESRHA